MKNTLIKNGKVFVNGAFEIMDVLVADGMIAAMGKDLAAEAEVYDASGKYVLPGLVDLHAHLRDPGQLYKEDMETGTRAAAKGGYTTICSMPNTDPVCDNIATVEYIKRKANDVGFCRVMPIGAMTKKSEGKEIAEYGLMKEGGIVAVSDDGNCVQDARLTSNCFKYASGFDLPVIIHAEDYRLAGSAQINAGLMSTKLGLSGMPGLAEEIIIARDLMLAEASGCRLHIAHISTAKAVELVRQAKARGQKVTCEVTPHHLTLTEDACATFDTNTKVKPPLRSDSDRLACIKGLLDGTIDCIATDHAPHADFEKEKEFQLAPYGINGFETALASLYTTLVEPGIITLELLVQKLTADPARVLNLTAGILATDKPADLTVVDFTQSQVILAETMLSKSKNTPWLGKTLKGRVLFTMCGGKVVWKAE